MLTRCRKKQRLARQLDWGKVGTLSQRKKTITTTLEQNVHLVSDLQSIIEDYSGYHFRGIHSRLIPFEDSCSVWYNYDTRFAVSETMWVTYTNTAKNYVRSGYDTKIYEIDRPLFGMKPGPTAFIIPDTIIATSFYKRIQLHHVISPKQTCKNYIDFAHESHITSITSIDPGDRTLFASTSHDKTLKFWNLKKLKPKPLVTLSHDFSIRTGLFEKKRNVFITGVQNGNLVEWDIETYKQLRNIKISFYGIYETTQLKDDRIACGMSDGRYHLYDLRTDCSTSSRGRLPVAKNNKDNSFCVSSLVAASDGHTLVIGDDGGRIHTVDLRKPDRAAKVVRSPTESLHSITRLAELPTGRIIANSYSHTSVTVYE